MSESERSAFEFGRQSSQAMLEKYEERKNLRFNPIFENFLGVLRGQLQKALNSEDAPPLVAGRIEYSIYLEEIASLKTRMIEEMTSAMEDWLTVIDIESRDLFEKFIEKDASDCALTLTTNGLQILINYTDALKDADTVWRSSNPMRALDFPENE